VLPIAIKRQTGRLESLPEIVSRGFALAEDGSDFMQSRPSGRGENLRSVG
jgi:hypothetical protein